MSHSQLLIAVSDLGRTDSPTTCPGLGLLIETQVYLSTQLSIDAMEQIYPTILIEFCVLLGKSAFVQQKAQDL